MKTRNVIKFFVAVVVSQLAGAVGALFTVSSVSTWYTELTKPAFTPPGWIFGPVWTMLYLLMGVAAFLVWKEGWSRNGVRLALGLFLLQLALNALWSVIFFGRNFVGWAFIEIILLWLAILSTALSFRRISRTAFWLMLPYLLWVSFAGYLNISIWLLN
ncbi:TspO protein [Candidatus Uhrbacteria bacterium CG_4_10_14_0_8_um_filter_58_22]|uniref:TspO protein n=1 Tax=Candidatus Uhrbacteria bacterium CG_4_10_14_0_8_um_filter_58_22 TaxID=1975029 RepID=A0A2M7QA81_9BACT|nr:MAG: TspO protein [Parcubacteria group bacterium CG1_02_58_44]PIY62109.1 MAG: TspO protein [Candidatus Uhrbacteria bacterium CG_4_10_14_0_8_um_filter_58_22]